MTLRAHRASPLPKGWIVAFLLASSAVVPAAAEAQLERVSSGAFVPSTLLGAGEDAFSLELSPALLPLMPSWSLAYVHSDAPEDQRFDLAGDSLYFALPLPFGLGAGLGLSTVRPTNGSMLTDRRVFTFGLGLAPARSLSFGAALRVVAAADPSLDGLVSSELAASWRPWRLLGLSVVLRDLTSPRYGYGTRYVPFSVAFAASIRPLGTRALTLEGAGVIDEDGVVGARGALELGVPYVGRVVAEIGARDLSGEDEEVRASAGIAVDWGQASAFGGGIGGDGFDGAIGHYFGARLEGAARPGIPTGSHVEDVELRGSLSPRAWVRSIASLDRALHDESVAGVLLRLRATSMGLADAQELRLMIAALEDAGKPVLCHLDVATGAELYACRAARRVLLDPAGGVRIVGPQSESLLLGELVERAGLRADFVRIGRYKSAAEQLINRAPSAGATEANDALLDDVYRRFVSDLSADLERTPAQIRDMIDNGPYIASETVEAGIVDALADEQRLEDEIEAVFGEGASLGVMPQRVPPRWGEQAQIGVVMIDGTIVDGENVDIPVLDVHMTGGRAASRAIEALARDPSVRAIVVRIDSPGGSALASDQIWRAIRRARERKPVIASLGSVAASGGYYVAAATDEIWSDPSTVTGSIGIFFGKVDVASLAERFGVVNVMNGRGRRAGAESIWRPFTGDERDTLAQKIRTWYRMFLRRVAEGRGMGVREVDAVARGRIHSGDSARALGLVDRLGGFGAALHRARELGGLEDDAALRVVPTRPERLVDYVLGASGEAEAAEGMSAVFGVLGSEVRDFLRIALAFAHVGAGIPLAWSPESVSVR